MAIQLRDYQKKAVEELKNGSILCGGVGSGKSRTSLAYYYKENGGKIGVEGSKMKNPRDLYIITTARKRDTLEWEGELTPFLLSTSPECNYYKNKIVVDVVEEFREVAFKDVPVHAVPADEFFKMAL